MKYFEDLTIGADEESARHCNQAELAEEIAFWVICQRIGQADES